ncbi:hydroxyacid dehydrogenase [Rubellimicrobium arenae]|uniref:hydroxyacid dehydrogenase n=1 Tax=Rubellimicrobium arenae TaxID=2817372 RepID=UPI001B312134|nr:hydroxyacid dehydrogenase [Rubellimicrobium arenae]
MPHLLIAGKLHPAGLDRLASAPGVTFDYVEEVSEPAYLPFIDKAEGLVIRTQPLSAATVERARNLKIVSRHGVGYDAVDVAALNARRIPLAIVGDVNSVSVAEHAMTLLLAAAKRLVRADRAVRDPALWGWRNRLEAGEISGKRLLILGYGRIGRQLGRMAQAFGLEVRAHDPFLLSSGWPEGPVHPVDTLAEGLAWADAVSVHAPKVGAPLIGAAEFAVMKPGMILVNTARGGVVDEGALAGALASGVVGAAGLDVFEGEPPAADHPLLAFDQVVLTPHIAALTAECAERMAVMSVDNALSFFQGRIDSDLIVNRDFT